MRDMVQDGACLQGLGRIDLTGANLGHSGRYKSQPKALGDPRRQCWGPPACQGVQVKEISFSGCLPDLSPNASPGQHPHHQHSPANSAKALPLPVPWLVSITGLGKQQRGE